MGITDAVGIDAVGITDARTRVEHLVTDVSAMVHRHAGRYLALCGVEVVAASLAERERAANDELVAALLERARAIQALADPRPQDDR